MTLLQPGVSTPSVRVGSVDGAGPRLLAETVEALGAPPTEVITLPERPGVTAPWPDWVAPDLRTALERQGVARLWQHQVEAADAAWSGHHVVLATGTASGKSVAYWLPALTATLTERSTVLYCTPTKALANDQRARLHELDLPTVNASCYDGDTDRELRPWIRRSSRFVLTNPDMLHRGILPRAAQWRPFLQRLRFVVLDEGHMYRGVFGANVAAVITRLRRLTAALGAEPVFIITSATLGNPDQAAGDLLGVHPGAVTAVTADTAARGARTVLLHDPSRAQPEPADDPAAEPISAFTATTRVLAAWVDGGIRSVGFLRSRAGVEAMATAVQQRTGAGAAVTAYRGGLLPEERRVIERGLRDGDLRCVASTNALELGVDIAGLDAVAMCGWPGTRLSFFQQLGRAGRTGAHALAVLTAQENPLDRYYVTHPDRIFDQSLEACVFDRGNPYVLLGHIACAVSETPMTTDEALASFGPVAREVLDVLAARGMIRLRGERWFWVERRPAHEFADLRGCSQPTSIIESDTGRVMGTVDGSSAPAQLHPGAVYTHLGVTHVVESLDLAAGIAVVRRDRPGYTTIAQSVSDLHVLAERDGHRFGAGTLHFGDVEVTGQVVGFLKREAGSGRVIGSEPLAMPPSQLRTTAVWWRLDADAVSATGLHPTAIAGAAHAAEHASIGVLPALATCDRWDIGGLSTELHADTGDLSVFVYDGHQGGAGFARRGFDAATEWLSATLAVIEGCDCADGCPGCVQSPKCGNGNDPLHKKGASVLLRALLQPTDAAAPNHGT